MGKRLKYVLMAVVLGTLLAGSVMPVPAQQKKAAPQQQKMTKEQMERRIQELEKKREADLKARQQTLDANRLSADDLAKMIAPYERMLASCATGERKGDRCAEAMFELGKFYYDQARDEFIVATERFAKEMDQYERTGRGVKPVHPVPDYSKSLGMYWRLTREYPNYPRLPDAFIRMGTTYLVGGHIDTARIIWEQLIQRFPQSRLVSIAHFNLGDLAFMDNNFNRAYDHYKKVKRDQTLPTQWEMTHFRRGECANNLGDFDEAVKEFFSYVEECDKGSFTRKEYREQALEYMASAFADMENGVQEATKFFAKNKKPYEAQVIYNIGAKNRDRGQWDAAILALEGALKRFPMYRDAPIARQRLIECYVVKKDPKANEERERLVDDYGAGSKWHQANANEKVVIDLAKTSVRRALGDIALYYHGQAQRTKNQQMYQTAMKRYNEFFQKFPDDKWRVFEYKYNVAEIYQNMGDCEKAAENYNYVAMQDLSTYPPYVSDVDTLGMDAEDLEKLRAQAGSKSNPIAISQEDAGFNTIVALDNCRKKEIAREGVSEEKSYALPSTKKLIEHCMNFQKRFDKSPNAPEVLYLAGNIHFGGKAFPEAIIAFKQVVDHYPNAKITPNAARMLGNSYSNNNQFDLAMQTFDNLLAKTSRDAKEYDEVMELAAGSMYRQAENMKKSGNMAGAADAFKAIAGKFRESKVAAQGWFEAGVCYEETKDYMRAAQTFEDLAQRQSTVREAAFIRAAENYKKANEWERAAQVYLTAANQIPKAEFAIPSLSSASEAYQKLNQFDMAGKMFELIFERYRNDPKTPQALYNAGLIFEKGKHYHDAIKVYGLLAENYPSSEFAGEAFFAIGLCYEKLEQFSDMANSFTDYADKYTNDRLKQVQALVKAGSAYYKLGNDKDAESNYNKAIKIFEQHAKTADIDQANVAQAYYGLGEIRYKKFANIKLDAANEKAMAARMKEKTEAMKEPIRLFGAAVELGVEEWTMRSMYMIARAFYDMADAVANQKLFGNQVEQMGGKIRVLSSLEKFYDQAMEYFGKNIMWAKEQNLTGEYIDMSMQAILEMAYKKGYILEEVGLLFKNSPVPPISRDFDEEMRELYVMELEERYLKALDAAMPKYEDGIRMAQEIGIAEGEWLDKIRERLRTINPESEMIDAKIVAWKPTPKPKQYDAEGREIAPRPRDPEFERNMRRIKNIMDMNISVDEKISQLNRIRDEAKRNIVLEQGKIESLKHDTGS
ncbi:MAG: tetratricopeptide repeat protein [Chitinispirillia bacterium]|nr:tetratricopeptide repeat protein [Chitinispirillia bacterium]MCL2241777.1 tetratricopeptide repeat protein [Chitinispirillia bacterium]